ncbi:MAG: acetyl/propionyl/methylcrotonyl-CoA carboxylase subunit alpha [Rhizobiaceae bacterium]|jgi:propionyl-CoA carboxylase alpha chain|nr:acetyl/propionyl/methylcrotonyl-CoA carboxylase subunit alpha [Rhizobiaceae bacterium]
MFKKILIANRGEIACRVIKTARRMGIETVAVFSDADRNALHVAMADEAVHIGAAPAAQSYLLIDRIVEACRQTGAQAVHPGYGFLSERAAFPEALAKAGVVFIGPPPAAIIAMGDKIESKRFAKAAGVSTVPGFDGIIETAEDAERIADEIGYPVMIKASAGGGGKGMRIAHSRSDVRDGFDRARSEAKSSFGDDRVFIEKFIVDPRHIEIQVLADGHGNAIYLGERECSIQRRNQKVIEEAPSPFLDEKTRAAMGAQSVALAKAVGYASAGTVEFIVDRNRDFYFLEMNTRLQVEHPVTELITGIDLVEQMIRVAAGERLSIAQADVKLNGWAVESRVYAEDPYRGFLPSTGRLTRYQPPAEGPMGKGLVRNDTGVFEGADISMFYDPMIAKLCTWAPDRATAIATMATALDAFVVDGIAHNVPFLADLMRQPDWLSGDLTTGFIAKHYPDGFSGRSPNPAETERLALVALAIELRRRIRLDAMTGRLRPHAGSVQTDWVVKFGRDAVALHVVQVNASDGTDFVARVMLDDEEGQRAGEAHRVVSHGLPHEPLWRGEVGGAPVTVKTAAIANGVRLTAGSVSVAARVMLPHVAALDDLMPERAAPDMSRFLLCPMPGLVVALHVAQGQEVKAGDTLAVIEAMKMENTLRAEKDGVIAKVNAKQGDSLPVDAVILEFA